MKTLIAAYSGVLRGTGSSILSALQDLSAITWLNRSKVEKQLQVISVLQWVLSFLVLGQMHLLQSIRSTFQGLCVRPSSCPLFWIIQLMGIPGSSVSVPSWVPPWAWGPLRPCFQDSCCRATFPRRAEGWDRRAVYQGPSVTRPSLRLPLTSRLTGAAETTVVHSKMEQTLNFH